MAACLSDWCQQQQISVTRLAELTGLEEDRVLAIYLGRWTPAPNERQKIAAALHVPATDIIWGHKTPVQRIYGSGPG